MVERINRNNTNNDNRNSTKSRRKAGFIGEEEAVFFLMNNGYAIVQRNFRTRGGEIDIIATQGTVLLFVEVKTSIYSEDSLEYSVNSRKRNKIITTSQYFLMKNPEYKEYTIRYDIIFISQHSRKIIHLKSAFDVPVYCMQ